MRKLLKLNTSKEAFDESIMNWENSISDFEKKYFYKYLYKSNQIKKILIQYKNGLYIKYPEFKHKNKKPIEIQFKKRMLTQNEMNAMFMPINKQPENPFVRISKIFFRKIYSVYKNMGQWKLQINLNNGFCIFYFFGIIIKKYNSRYQEYIHEVMPDNYCIISWDEL